MFMPSLFRDDLFDTFFDDFTRAGRKYLPANGVAIPGLDRRVTDREYRRVRAHMEALGLPGFLQEAEAADADFIPVFNQDESFV